MILQPSQALQVQLPKFEGPLELLLYLVKREEMNIFDIEIHSITKSYLDYIESMKKLDLEVAGEFIAIAATLLEIKSYMLLPNYGESEDEELEDPRKELAQTLLEYQRFRTASQILNQKTLLGRDIFARGMKDKFASIHPEEIVWESNPLLSLLIAYHRVENSNKKEVYAVSPEPESIISRIRKIKEHLSLGKSLSFFQFLSIFKPNRSNVIMNFISLLEMGKLGFVKLYQNSFNSDIYISSYKEIQEEDLIHQIQSEWRV